MKTALSLRMMSTGILAWCFLLQSTNGQGEATPAISLSTNSISNLSFYYQEGPSTSHSITITCSNLAGVVDISPPDGFEISNDNLTFQNFAITLPASTTEATFYTRLRENQPIDTYTGMLTITSINASTQTVFLSGEIWTKDAWDYVEDFNHSNLGGSYANNSFTGNNGLTWNYTSCRNERGYGNNFMYLTHGIKLNKEANEGKVTALNLPGGIKSFECKLYKGSSSSTNVEASLWINDTEVAVSDKFNDDEIHYFKVDNINVSGPFNLEIRNNRSVTLVVDDISWSSYNDPATTYIESSHNTISDIIRAVDDSYQQNAVITIHAKNLLGDVQVSAPSRFLISGDNSTFSSSLTLDMGSGTLGNKNIYIRLDPIQALRKYSGDLLLTSVGAQDVTIGCTGATRPAFYTPLMINEVDADTKDLTGTSGTDEYDFIELYSGTPGIKDLTGYVLVTYNGSNNQVHKNYVLDGYSTNEQGYFVMGNDATLQAMENYLTANNLPLVANAMVSNNDILQNGPDAVALYYGVGGDFSEGDTLWTLNLVDAMVYSLSDENNHYPVFLMPLLNPLQPYVNENAFYNDTIDKQTTSMGRFFNGQGGLRNTSTYVPCFPSPGAENISYLGENGLPTKNKLRDVRDYIQSYPSTLVVSGDQTGTIEVYTLEGRLAQSVKKTGNPHSIPLPRGIYLVRFTTSHTSIAKVVSTY